ncbi:PHA/PHB synthase family protein [Rhodopseudomonas sp. RCAM05734]|uniref:PHA/PHB synthase family protein n=1 Tax=Rhodopseudomonas sp. RCAM05734 TaxID=3457549 RepID=UPI0040441C68
MTKVEQRMASSSPLPRVAEPAPPHRAPVAVPDIVHPVAAAGDQALHEPHDADRAFHAMLAQLTGGLSPTALAMAWLDWAAHLASAPAKRLDTTRDAVQRSRQLATYAVAAASSKDQPAPLIAPLPQDRRFAGPDWQLPPFNLMAQAFLLSEQWWHNATTGVRGVAPANEAIVEFSMRQPLDVLAPSNFAATNPDVLRKTIETGGENFVRGWQNFCSDWSHALAGEKSTENQSFVVGKTVATAAGKVVFRNRLIELIQYQPTTAKVHPEPILIVPAWIMKYYILDLSPHNSLVKFLTDAGFTVFMISWRNPGSADRDISLEDYRRLGVDAAVATIADILPDRGIHALGYCLGGTLLSIAAAAMARDGDTRLKSITLLAAQTDFTEAGELSLFINESQVAFLEDMMWQRGVLDTTQMAGAFQILRSNDLIWSKIVHDYLMDERAPPSDLMAWNADATRLPYRMHSEYLRQPFLHNDLAEGRYLVDGRPISLSDIHTPMFVVGTVRDHVAPWKSAYKIHFLVDADVTYLLTSGGHNAGIVAPPDQPSHSYQVLLKPADGSYIGPDEWLKTAPHHDGSWWPEWTTWLTARSGALCDPPPMGGGGADARSLPDAPGDYVRQP